LQRSAAGTTSRSPETEPERHAAPASRTLHGSVGDLLSVIDGLVGQGAGVTIARPDAAGRLRVTWRRDADGSQPLGIARHRRTVHREQRAMLLEMSQDRGVAIVPLTTPSASSGTLEIHASRERLSAAWDVMPSVARHLATMLEAIDESERLRREVRALQAALAEAHAAAAERRRRLDMGLAWTAHEIKGPLLGVRAALEVMDGHDEDPGRRAMVQDSVRELDQMVGTTEALLTWAAGTRGPEPTPQDLVALVQDAMSSNRLETGVASELVRAPGEAIADVDRRHLRTAMMNLLRNAAGHADPGTTIEVAITEGTESLEIHVTDTGRPISAAAQRSIFDPFVRGEEPAREGNGLGLFITRRVVEAHGGSVRVRSGGRRTTFTISLPADRRGARRFAS
jgi:signal transduction histidine kinase